MKLYRFGIFLALVVGFLFLVGLYLYQTGGVGGAFNLPKNTTVIDLRGRGLTSLPAEIGEYTATISLLLDDNQLTGALPAEIRKMKNLEILSASDNNLTGIPAEIGQLSNLKLIDFSNNNISTYPNELLQLQQPLTLLLQGNDFSDSQIEDIRQRMPGATITF